MPSQRTIGIIHTTESRHATGLPNPSADYILVVIGEVRGHDPRRRGASYVSLQIGCVEFDLPATYSGDGSRDDRRGVVSSGGMGGACRSILGGGGDGILAVHGTESSLPRLFDAPLVAAKFSPRAMRDAKASPDGSIGTPFVAATFHLRAVRGANAPLLGFVGTPILAASFHLRAVRDANASRPGSVCAPLVAATFHLRAVRDANASLDGSVGAPLLAASLTPRAVRDANASPGGSVGAPLVAALFTPRAVRDANASPDGYVDAPIPFAILSTHLLMN